MTPNDEDRRSDARKAGDERIAAEPPLPHPELSADAKPVPMEVLRARGRRHPVALPGVVENGVVRLIDPDVKLPEHARVIVVAEGA